MNNTLTVVRVKYSHTQKKNNKMNHFLSSRKAAHTDKYGRISEIGDTSKNQGNENSRAFKVKFILVEVWQNLGI